MTQTSDPLRLIAVAAMASNRVIGKNGKLPWKLPEDLEFFKQLTTGYPVIMGRRTFESIGRPLPKRRNIIISNTLKTAPTGTDLVASIDSLRMPSNNLSGRVFVIGGAQIYTALMPQIDEIYLSYIFEDHQGDVTLPEFEKYFNLKEVIKKYDAFEVRHYFRNTLK
jgi:dihydrofolate reductase